MSLQCSFKTDVSKCYTTKKSVSLTINDFILFEKGALRFTGEEKEDA